MSNLGGDHEDESRDRYKASDGMLQFTLLMLPALMAFAGVCNELAKGKREVRLVPRGTGGRGGYAIKVERV